MLDARALAVLDPPPPPEVATVEPAAVSFYVKGRMVQWRPLDAARKHVYFDSAPWWGIGGSGRYVQVDTRLWAADGTLLDALPTQVVKGGDRYSVTIERQVA
jgi:hypothetical protein